MKRYVFYIFIGFVGFILSFGIAGYFLLIPKSTEFDKTTERLKQQVPTPETAKLLPPGEVERRTEGAKVLPEKLEDILVNWPDNADWPVNWKELTALPPEEYYKLPQKTRLAIARAFYASYGLDIPPEGHHYAQNNETGKWELQPNNKPVITIVWKGNSYGQLHQLTDEEYERYKALHRIATNPESVASHLANGGHLGQFLAYPIAACELANQWYNVLHEKTRGPAPSATANAFYDREYTEADKERDHRLIRKAIDTVTPPRRDSNIDNTILNQILDEIEIELGITIERETQAEKESRKALEHILINIPDE